MLVNYVNHNKKSYITNKLINGTKYTDKGNFHFQLIETFIIYYSIFQEIHQIVKHLSMNAESVENCGFPDIYACM